jgi:hypothetical protein
MVARPMPKAQHSLLQKLRKLIRDTLVKNEKALS